MIYLAALLVVIGIWPVFLNAANSLVRSPPARIAGINIDQPGIKTSLQDPVVDQEEFSNLSGLEKAKVLRRRPSERIPDTELSVELFGRLLTIGGEVSYETEARRDSALATEPDDLDRKSLDLELELFYAYSDQSAAFVEIKGRRQADEKIEINESETESRVSRGEMWFYTGGWYGDTTGVQVGRQKFSDDREWWWDEKLDAVRFHYDTESLHAEIGIAQELAPVSSVEDSIDPEEDGVLRVISSLTWLPRVNHESSLFFLIQSDDSNTELEGEVVNRDRRDESDLDAIWMGGRKQGKYRLDTMGRLYYWLDVGLVAGSEKLIDYDTIDSQNSIVASVDHRDVRAAGFDIGVSWRTRFPGQMTFTLGYAAGSGDRDRSDNTDTSYRQSGLQGNDAKFRGVTSFNYYGELLSPELSNISITTLGLGFRFLPESSIDLVYHNYRQFEASDDIPGSDLDLDPAGIDTRIGSELDLIIGIEEWERVELELVAAFFKAGSAFTGLKGKVSTSLSIEISYRF